MSDITLSTFKSAVDKLKASARVALHFHPDRPDGQLRPVAAALLEQGIYKSQFETRLSNGSVSAYPGGQRDEWEKRIFGRAYHRYGATDSERPKYGALDIMLHPDGPSPRFGSCYFLLSPVVSRRCSFTYLDSHQDPPEKGTYEAFDDILAALLKELFFRDFALGLGDLTPRKFIHHLQSHFGGIAQVPLGGQPSRNLNHYIEAQVHGDVSLADDVDILVADPSFKGTMIGQMLEEVCLRYAVELHWHMGFQLKETEVPSDFRGPSMPSLARRIARGGVVDAATIGVAATSLKRSPELWSDLGSYEDVLQELKLLWHVLVKFGETFADNPRQTQ
jgi:hypothetical protein